MEKTPDVSRNPSRRNALLCPGCRKLVSADEPKCPYCGLSTPGSRWKNNILAKGINGGERLIYTIIAVNVVMYLFSLLLSSRGLHLTGNPTTIRFTDCWAGYACPVRPPF